MKDIHIFLASSIDEFKEERRIIGDFIRGINDILHKTQQGIYLILDKCEDMSQAVSKTRKQDDINRMICEAHLFYILVGKDLRKYTLEEFDIANKTYRSTNFPKIITFFKNPSVGESVTDTVIEFQKYLDEEIGHFFNKYKDIDTIKLNIILELMRENKDMIQLEIDNGRVLMNSIDIKIDMNKHSFYANCEELQRIRKEIDIIEESLPLKNKKFGDFTREEYENVLSKMNRKMELEKQMYKVENSLLAAASKIVEITSEGKALTKRTKKAIVLFEQGKSEDALNILNDIERKKDILHLNDLSAILEEEYRAYLNEIEVKINILCAKNVKRDIEDYIITLYKEGLEQIVKYNIDTSFVIEYLQFLYSQGRTTLFLETLDELIVWEKVLNKKYDAKYLATKAEGLKASGHYDKAIRTIQETLDEIAVDENTEIMHTKVVLMHILACTYFDMQKYSEAIKIIEDIILNVDNKSFESPRGIHSMLGGLYTYRGELKKAKIQFELAEKEQMELSERAVLYNNFGYMYEQLGEFADAKDYYQKSIDIKERKVMENPGKWGKDLLITYLNLSNAYIMNGELEHGINVINSALNIGEELAIYGEDILYVLSGVYNAYGLGEQKRGNYDMAIDKFEKSLELIERINKHGDSPSFDVATVSTLHNLSCTYRLYGDIAKSLAIHRKCEKILDDLIIKNPGNHEQLAIKIYADACIGFLKSHQHDMKMRLEKKLMQIMDNNAEKLKFNIHEYKASYYWKNAQIWKAFIREVNDNSAYKMVKDYYEKALKEYENIEEKKKEHRVNIKVLENELKLIWLLNL